MTEKADSSNTDPLPEDDQSTIQGLVNRLRPAISQGDWAPLETLLEESDPRIRGRLLEELIVEHARARAERGETPRWDDYARRFTAFREAAWQGFRRFDPGATVPPGFDADDASSPPSNASSSDSVSAAEDVQDSFPHQLGEYEVVRLLGEGAFGQVFQARHPSRGVFALKRLKQRWANMPEYRETFLREARTTMQFDHAHVVKVYELRPEADPPYFVQEYVGGGSLADRLSLAGKLPYREAANLVIQIAEGLAHVHATQNYHRDLKPANILLDEQGQVRVADFGLVLQEAQRWDQPRKPVGTFTYMPPEQLRGSPNLNAKCDIWSVGVIFYRMLTGALPFRRPLRDELCQEIFERTPDEPSVLDASIPREINHLCMRCLEKDAKDRPNARDLADLLRKELAQDARRIAPGATQLRQPLAFPEPRLTRFTRHESDLYLRLMPKSYANVEELPEVIAFWKHQITRQDGDQAFRVGVLVGVSGCGKSSMLEAGLLAKLPAHVHAIRVEASEHDTEAQLVRKLAAEFPSVASLDENTWSLPTWLKAIRRGEVAPPGQKVLLVLDQFEQWLHAHGGDAASQLIVALEQCDGVHLQTLVCVREGFHASLTRFAQFLGMRLNEDANYQTAHRFSSGHARYVLEQFGRGQKNLQDALTAEQEAFLDAAVQALADADHGVVCVRLVVLALVMQERPWTVAELRKLGGMEGIGRQFLQDQFQGRASSEWMRRSKLAAMRTLESLLPAEGLEIKDTRTYAELWQASETPKPEFDTLLDHLVRKLFLLTPVDLETGPAAEESPPIPPAERSYQLTHDFLVPSVRQWIQWEEEQSPAGRMRLKLRQLAGAWRAGGQEKRYLPSLMEYLQIRRFTRSDRWTDTQKQFMKSAARYHARWTALATALLAAVCLLIFAGYYEAQANRLATSLLNADVSRVTQFRREDDGFAWRADARFRQEIARADDEVRVLHARIGLAASDPNQHDPLRRAMLDADLPLEYLQVIGDALKDANADFTSELWTVMRDPTQTDAVRLRAALTLSLYRPHAPEDGNSRWTEADGKLLIANYLAANPEFYQVIRSYLKPNVALLSAPLAWAFTDDQLTVVRQQAAAKAVADFFPGGAKETDFQALKPLLLSASPEQFPLLFPLVRNNDMLDQELLALVRNQPSEELTQLERVQLGRQRANAAITLLLKGRRDESWDVLKVQGDPEAMTQFVHRSRRCGVAMEQLLELWDRPSVPKLAERAALPAAERKRLDSQLFGLLLALGEYTWSQVPDDRRPGLLHTVSALFRDDKSSGVHAAAGWLLRHWGNEDETILNLAKELDQREVKIREGWEWHTVKLEVDVPGSLGLATRKTFYQTYVLIEAGNYDFGSPEEEPGRDSNETPHQQALDSFWILERELTRGEVEAPGPLEFFGYQDAATSVEHAMVAPNWYDAVRYSRWLSDQLGYADSQAYAAEAELLESQYRRDDADPNRGVYNWPVDLSARGYRLPTEHEWEASCRGGTLSAFSFGSDQQLLPFYGWFLENSGGRLFRPRELRPTLRGLFDVHGNAREWCHDWHDIYSTTNSASGPASGSLRTLRGGSWAAPPLTCRSAIRMTNPPSIRNATSGFRVVRRALPLSQAGD